MLAKENGFLMEDLSYLKYRLYLKGNNTPYNPWFLSEEPPAEISQDVDKEEFALFAKVLAYFFGTESLLGFEQEMSTQQKLDHTPKPFTNSIYSTLYATIEVSPKKTCRKDCSLSQRVGLCKFSLLHQTL